MNNYKGFVYRLLKIFFSYYVVIQKKEEKVLE